MFVRVLILEYFDKNRFLMPPIFLALHLSEAGDVQEVNEPEAVPPENTLLVLIIPVLHLVVERLDENLTRANIQVEELVFLATVHEVNKVRIDCRLLVRVLRYVLL